MTLPTSGQLPDSLREAIGPALYKALAQFPELAGRISPYHTEICAKALAALIAKPDAEFFDLTGVCEACGGNGYSGGVVPKEPELCDACEVCLGDGRAWFTRHADRKRPQAFINTDPAYFASECASAIMTGRLVKPTAETTTSAQTAEAFEEAAKVADRVAKECGTDLRNLKRSGDDLPGEAMARGGQIEALRIAAAIRALASPEASGGECLG